MTEVRKVVFLVGVPGSGKSTFARELVRDDPTFKRINKDDLRYMFHDEDFKKFDRKKEDFIVEVRDALILKALDGGFNVVVDDTNIEPKHWDRVRYLVSEWATLRGIEVTVEKKVFETTLDECTARNSQRTGPARVPVHVIKTMHAKLTAAKRNRVYRPYTDGLCECIVGDMDGTFALMGNRLPYATTGLIHDPPNEPVIRLALEQIDRGVPLVVVSGRKECCREETEAWLQKYGLIYDQLFMRADGDNRSDALVKTEIYVNKILPFYNVKFVLDDRNKVVEAIRDLGLPVFQVAWGDF